MRSVSHITGPAAPLLLANIDTEVIVRVPRLMEFKKGELARFLFEPLRYSEDGRENPSFVLNQHGFRHSVILLTGENFGCGSSREGAVWALQDFGIQCVIAPSFGDIFVGNCLQNGLLPVVLDSETISRLAHNCGPGKPNVSIDLKRAWLTQPPGDPVRFDFPEWFRSRFLSGADDLDETLGLENSISTYQSSLRKSEPWLFPDPSTVCVEPAKGEG